VLKQHKKWHGCGARPDHRKAPRAQEKAPLTRAEKAKWAPSKGHGQHAWRRLLELGLLKMPRKCKACKSGRYSKDVFLLQHRLRGQRSTGKKTKTMNHWVLRCTSCHSRLNTVSCGPWPARWSRAFTLEQVDQILYQWCHAKRSPPSARSLSALVKADRRAVWRFLSFLRDKTAAAAATQALKPVLDQKGLVAKEKAAVYEVDGTHIGKFYISARSRTWASEIKAWAKRHGKLPKYFQVHSRVVGLTSRRTGALWIQPLSLKLIPRADLH
ncbi:unnamed protein product, partial [Effrenium voratum]